MTGATNGRRGRPTAVVELSNEDREVLERWARWPSTAQALAMRSKIVLASADGATNTAIGAAVGCHPNTAGKWRTRFVEAVDGLVVITMRNQPGQSPTPSMFTSGSPTTNSHMRVGLVSNWGSRVQMALDTF